MSAAISPQQQQHSGLICEPECITTELIEMPEVGEVREEGLCVSS